MVDSLVHYHGSSKTAPAAPTESDFIYLRRCLESSRASIFLKF